MTSKLHIEPVFNNRASNFITRIQAISSYSLLASILILLTLTVSITPAQAELVDLSNPEPVIQLSTQDASWLKPPKFDRVARSMDRYLRSCSYDQDGNIVRPCDRKELTMVFSLHVDQQGSIKDITVIESSGKEVIDKRVTRELYKAQFKPFVVKGQAVKGNVTLPIEFK